MTKDLLEIELEDRLIGKITTVDDGLAIRFERDYATDLSATPFSVSMPKTRTQHLTPTPDAWLWGLLPDNEDVLRRWAREYDASLRSPASLLATEIGLDCAGAVRFYPKETIDSSPTNSGVQWLTADEMDSRIDELTSDSSSWLASQPVGQFSLAGAQTKTALRFDDAESRWGLPYGREPSTHILKPAITGFEDQHINEHLCLAAAQNLNLVAASTTVKSFADQQVLVATRFDRRVDATTGAWVRVHQEDMCQALGVHPRQKYEHEGGPSARNIVNLIRTATGRTVADREVRRFIEALIFNWIIGGTDAHAKNYGFLHSGPQTRLAPLYHISSILPYDDSKGHKVKLAMKIGGEYKIKRIGRRAWERFASDTGIDPSWLLRRCEELATATPMAFEQASADFEKQQSVTSMPDQLTSLVAAAATVRLDSLSARSN